MAAFLSTDVTVALAQRDIVPLGMSKKMTFPSITFGGGPTYHATTKVPMPAIGIFGLKKAIERVFIEQPANGYIYHFDRTNHRIRIFLGAARAAITVANHANITVPAPANHSHNLVIAADAGNVVDFVGLTAANKFAANANGPFTIPGNVAANGGIADGAVPAPANIANLTHTVTGGDAVAEAALAEMDTGVVPDAVTLYTQMIGQ